MTLYAALGTLAWPFARWGRLQVHGTDAVAPVGPVSLVPNHDSQMDPVLIALALLDVRPIRFVGRANLWQIPGLAPLWDGIGAIPIHRGTGDHAAIHRSIFALRSGEAVCVFREGRLSRGRALRAGTGIVRIWRACPEAKVLSCASLGRPTSSAFLPAPALWFASWSRRAGSPVWTRSRKASPLGSSSTRGRWHHRSPPVAPEPRSRAWDPYHRRSTSPSHEACDETKAAGPARTHCDQPHEHAGQGTRACHWRARDRSGTASIRRAVWDISEIVSADPDPGGQQPHLTRARAAISERARPVPRMGRWRARHRGRRRTWTRGPGKAAAPRRRTGYSIEPVLLTKREVYRREVQDHSLDGHCSRDGGRSREPRREFGRSPHLLRRTKNRPRKLSALSRQ